MYDKKRTRKKSSRAAGLCSMGFQTGVGAFRPFPCCLVNSPAGSSIRPPSCRWACGIVNSLALLSIHLRRWRSTCGGVSIGPWGFYFPWPRPRRFPLPCPCPRRFPLPRPRCLPHPHCSPPHSPHLSSWSFALSFVIRLILPLLRPVVLVVFLVVRVVRLVRVIRLVILVIRLVVLVGRSPGRSFAWSVVRLVCCSLHRSFASSVVRLVGHSSHHPRCSPRRPGRSTFALVALTPPSNDDAPPTSLWIGEGQAQLRSILRGLGCW